MRAIQLFFIAIVISLVMITPTALGASPDEPHGHRGLLTPITSSPTPVLLTAAERVDLEAGKYVERHSKGEDGGSGVAIQYINASPEVIWQTILNYPRYKDWVKNVVNVTVYKRDGDHLYVDMQTSVFGFKSRVFTKNIVRKSEGYMAWTLDYDRKSDVSDLVGYWRVVPVEGMNGVTRLEHSNSIQLKGVPGFLVNYMTRDALSEGTAWVKREAEKR